MDKKNEALTRRQMIAGSTATAAVLAAGVAAQAQPAPLAPLAQPPAPDLVPVPREMLKAWTTDFATKINEGVSLIETMEYCTERAQNDYLRRVSAGVASVVALGYPLSRAMSMHPEVFSPDYITSVRYGEMHGIVDETLNALLKNWDTFIR